LTYSDISNNTGVGVVNRFDGQVSADPTRISGNFVGVDNAGSGSDHSMVTLTNSFVSQNGFGVVNRDGGELTIKDNTAVSENTWTGVSNLSGGQARLTHSTISGSVIGVVNERGTLKLTSSTVSDNVNAAGTGGAGVSNRLGTLTIVNSNIFGNTAEHYGGGVYNDGGSSRLRIAQFREIPPIKKEGESTTLPPV
jgi:hypothetical protein